MDPKKIFQHYSNSLRHFGLAMTLSKAWEKFVVDKHRFRPGLKRSLPVFAYSDQNQEMPPTVPKQRISITVCYLIHYFFPDKQGGTERFVFNLAKEQAALGNAVRVITLGKRPLERYTYQTGNIHWEEFFFEGIPVTQFRYRRAPRGLYYDELLPDDPDMRAFASETIERYRPDIVHFAYPQPFAAFAEECQRRKVPYCITLTDFNMFCHYATMVCKNGMFCSGSQRGRLCKRICGTYGVSDTQKRFANAERLLQGSAEVAVPSRFVAAVMDQEFFGMSMRVIPHGIGADFHFSGRRKKTKVFLYAGTLSELKGVHLLIKAFKAVPGDLTLKICGSGDVGYVRTLKRAAAEDARITFSGEVLAKDMPAIYRQADCVMAPSIWYETYNFVLREGLSCGCLGIAADIGAMPEVIREGKNGFVFTAGDVQSLQKALEKAVAFDWRDYQKSDFPSLEDEAAVYQGMYQKMRMNAYGRDQCPASGLQS